MKIGLVTIPAINVYAVIRLIQIMSSAIDLKLILFCLHLYVGHTYIRDSLTDFFAHALLLCQITRAQRACVFL